MKKTYVEKLEELRAVIAEKREDAQGLVRESRGAETQEILDAFSKRLDDIRKEIEVLESEEERLEILAYVETKVEYFRGFVPAGKEIVAMTQDEVAEIAKIIAKFGLHLRKELDDEIKEFAKIHAKHLFHKYKSLTEAGFGATMAAKILLAEIKPVGFVEMLKKAGENASASKKS